MPAAIEVRGYRELNRTLRKAADGGLVKAVGRANKRVGGRLVGKIEARSTAAAVGRGAGARPRASAAKSALKLRVGGKHRANPSIPVPNRSSERFALSPWGKRLGRDIRTPAPDRPHIKALALQERDWISSEWLDEIHDEIGF